MKIPLLIMLTSFGITLFGQSQSEKIKRINNAEQANAFIKTNPELNGEIIEINSTDNSETAKKIIFNGAEKPLLVGDHTYKVVETRKSFLLNAFYIYLDGSKLSMLQIDSTRQIIISKYNAGAQFADLVKEYNMDGNPNSDLKMIAEGALLKDFSEAVKAHNKGEVFKIDLPEKKWYYVTLKTAEEQEASTFSVLKVKNNN
jgi:hypothetical protein